jgi:tetratricopeptide (TPR) repeat protein
VVNKSPDTDHISSILPSIRLFRRRLGLRYEGIVHNRLAIPPDSSIVRTGIELYHYGYDLPVDKLKEKQARSRKLLEKQLHKNPDDVFANFNMAQLLLGLRGTADENTCREIVDHATRVIANYDPGQTGHVGYFLMAHYQAATALCALRRYDEAERFCRDALEKKADYLDAVLTLANVRLAREDLPGAREYYERYLELANVYRPDRERHDLIMHHAHSRHIARYGLATISRLENRIDEALKHYRWVSREYGPYLDTHYLMGLLHLRRGEPARAEEILAQEIEAHPELAVAHLAMAKAMELQGREDRAAELLESALTTIPNSVDIMFALAATLIRIGQIDNGVARIEAAVDVSEEDHRAHFRAAGLYFEIGDYENASGHYLNSLRLKPLWSEAYTNLGNCYFRLEMYEKACACYETALALAPDNDLARRNLGLALARDGRAAWSIAVLKEYFERSDDVEICRLVGDLSASTGNYPAAIEHYEKYLTAHPDDVGCLFNLAESYRNLGHHEAAEAGYRYLLILNPGYAPARDRLGMLDAARA